MPESFIVITNTAEQVLNEQIQVILIIRKYDVLSSKMQSGFFLSVSNDFQNAVQELVSNEIASFINERIYFFQNKKSVRINKPYLLLKILHNNWFLAAILYVYCW